MVRALRPQLEMAAPFFLPSLVQVDDQIQAAVDVQPFVKIEIGVDSERATTLDLVQTAATKMRVGHQAFDAGEVLEKRQKWSRVEHVDQCPCVRSELLFVFRRIFSLPAV